MTEARSVTKEKFRIGILLLQASRAMDKRRRRDPGIVAGDRALIGAAGFLEGAQRA
jgi:hypothetical protein